MIASFGPKSIASTLWNDDTLPEAGEYVGDITLQVSEGGWQIKSIYLGIY